MLRKVPREYYPVLNEKELTYEAVEKAFAVSIGIDDIFVIDDNNYLVGILSKRDFHAKRPIDIKELIKLNPIVIVANKYEKDMARAMFEKSVFVTTVPVVDKDRKLLHAYVKVNEVFEHNYIRETEQHSIDEYSRVIQETFDIERGRLGYDPYILTDITEYGGGLWEHLEKKIISIDDLDENSGTVILAYIFDFNAIKATEKCIEKKVPFIAVNPSDSSKSFGITPYYKMKKDVYEVLERESCTNSDYFDSGDFVYLFQALEMTQVIDGDYVEIGTYKGDSARAVLSYMKKTNIKRKAYFLDTYEGFSYDEAKESSDALWADTHTDTSIEFVRTRLSEFDDFELVKSNIITDALPPAISKIAVCNIDVDMYEAVGAALDKVLPYVTRGGVIIAEDYGHTPRLLGAHVATNSFYEKHKDELMGFYMYSGQFVMIKR